MLSLSIGDPAITAFTFELVEPLLVAKETLRQREGFYLELTATNGLKAKGEAAPLPGVSPETLKKAKHDAQEILPRLKAWEIPPEKDALIEKFRQDPLLPSVCPSVRFAVESAVFSLAAQTQGLALHKFLGADQADMASAVLLQGPYEQVITHAKKMAQEGRRVFKLKVGDRNTALDVKKVQDLRQVIGKGSLIRLDANGAWNFEQAALFAQLAGNPQVEFIEEPLNDPGRLNEFFQATRMPVALDESLAPALSNQEAVAAYVIKPTVIGGLIVTLEWIDEAKRLGKKAVISSAYESPVGLNVLKALAALTGQTPGLDTQRWFK